MSYYSDYDIERIKAEERNYVTDEVLDKIREDLKGMPTDSPVSQYLKALCKYIIEKL